MTYVLGIETSCDETAAAVVQDGREIASNVVASQARIHAQYGGVFPEIASRQHILHIVPVVEQALAEAGLRLGEIDAVAVTYGPGLAGSLLVGVNLAKGLALAAGLPLVGINHLEAHIYANWLEPDRQIQFPLICLLASGGHTNLVLMQGHGLYTPVGQTLDDAAGEAFDKVARLLSLGYPGGPEIERAAEKGDPTAFDLPRAWLKDTHNFSFSGLKTAVLYLVREHEPADDLPVADLAASFQAAVVEVLVEKTRLAAGEYGVRQVLLAGGVAANGPLRKQMAEHIPVPVVYPSPILCTDNAACVAAAGWFRLQAGDLADWDLDVVPGLALSHQLHN
ncbi:MAG TPA: tRNA (adenosine(37)-N6)-threonylcarbamoyltransferase complex transferase subunit TsaD [Anaerolineae bacterium]|nr:tRNA (adenosine(37)-N6)-threonylcarbamoyltransferase complex transferase subunit TsaD [Anaerolineae bacterium]